MQEIKFILLLDNIDTCLWIPFHRDKTAIYIWSGLLLLNTDIWPLRWIQASSEAGRLLGAVIRLAMCKTVHKCLFHCACGLVRWSGAHGTSYLCDLVILGTWTLHSPHHPTPPHTHPFIIIHIFATCKVGNNLLKNQ